MVQRILGMRHMLRPYCTVRSVASQRRELYEIRRDSDNNENEVVYATVQARLTPSQTYWYTPNSRKLSRLRVQILPGSDQDIYASDGPMKARALWRPSQSHKVMIYIRLDLLYFTMN